MVGRVANLVLLAFSTFTFFSSSLGIASIIARYGREFGFSLAETGFVFSAAPLAAALLRLPVGFVADRYGAKLFMVAGSAVMTASALYASLARDVPGLFMARLLQGVGLALYIGPSIAAASMLKGVEAHRAIPLRSASISAAATIAPIIVGVVTDSLGYSAAFTVAAVHGAAAAAASAMLKIVKPARHGGRVAGLRKGLSTVALLSLLSLIDGIVFFAYQALPQTHLADLGYPATVYGVALAASGVAGFFARLSTAFLTTRYGPARVMAMGYTLSAASLTVIAVGFDPLRLLMSETLYGIGLGLSVPSGQVLLMTSVPQEARNLAASIYTLAFDAGGFAGSYMFGLVAELEGYTRAYSYMAMAELVAAILAAFLATRARPH